jgi:hypothetical protein
VKVNLEENETEFTDQVIIDKDSVEIAALESIKVSILYCKVRSINIVKFLQYL